VLFSNAELASFIQTSFEPAWETVRQVPLVRIDFGNGKVLTRTLHGNIATSVCTAEGKVLDVLPGIYDPAAYRERLSQFRLLADYVKESGPAGEKRVGEYHRTCAKAMKENKAPPIFADTRTTFGGGIGGAPLGGFPPGAGLRPGGAGFGGGFGGGFQGAFPAVAGRQTGNLGLGGGFGGALGGFAGGFKGGIEMPVKVLVAAAPPPAIRLAPPAPPIIASGLKGPRARLATTGASETPSAAVPASDRALWERLETDTKLNETTRRRQVHELLATVGMVKPEAITKRVYKEILHADLEDPYLGLGPLLFGNYPFAAEDHGY
jgi:hypothetical protein